MEFERERRDTIAVYRVTTTEATLRSGADGFREELHRAVGDGARTIVVDFSRVNYADSTMLEAIVSTYKLLAGKGGCIAVCGLNEHLRNAFSITGVDRLVHNYEAVKDALAAAGQ